MPEVETEPQIVVIASDDPQRAATLLLHLLQIATAPMLLRLVAFGSDSGSVVEIAQAVHVYEPHRLEVYQGFDDRWDALDAGLAMLPEGSDATILSDDARPAEGWIEDLRAALFPMALVVTEELRAMPIVGAPFGLSGPVSEQARGAAQRISLAEHDVAGGLEAYAASRRKALAGLASMLDMPDDLALFIRRPVIDALRAAGTVEEPGRVLRPGLGLWTLADLAIRAEALGSRAVVAEACYVSRARPVASRPETPASAGDRLRFYRLHRDRTSAASLVVVAAIRVRLTCLRDLHLLRGTIGRVAPLVDGFALLLGNNPLDIQAGPEFAEALRQGDGGMLQRGDRELLQACDGADPAKVGNEFAIWAGKIGQGGAATGSARVIASVWTGATDDTSERSALQALVRKFGAATRSTNLWALCLESGELVEEGVTRDGLRRLCEHPNPSVVAYDLPTLTLWDSPRLVREDAPWGDGGTWKGGPSSTRLYRVLPHRDHSRLIGASWGRSLAAPLCSDDAIRVASVRLRVATLLRPIDRARVLRTSPTEEGMRLSSLRSGSRIGLHMLVYERENPEDVARWLDEVHGVVDAAVLVWTGAWGEAEREILPRQDFDALAFGGPWFPTGPGRELSEFAGRHGASVVYHPLADDIAAARNAGIDALAVLGLNWALFFDPDEWLRDPLVDARGLRRMAESTRWGWLVQVANYTIGGMPSISDSIRMSAIEPQMRMTGRVHESFGDAINALQGAEVHPRLSYSPFVLQHRGMALGADRTSEKLDAYERLLRLELADRPSNPGAWVSLAWHLDNDGHPALAEECLNRAVACAGNAYLPFRELGILRLRQARVLFDRCAEKLAPAHQYTRQAERIAAWLRENAPPPSRLERRAGRLPLPLPDFLPAGDAEVGSGYDPGEEGA